MGGIKSPPLTDLPSVFFQSYYPFLFVKLSRKEHARCFFMWTIFSSDLSPFNSVIEAINKSDLVKAVTQTLLRILKNPALFMVYFS